MWDSWNVKKRGYPAEQQCQNLRHKTGDLPEKQSPDAPNTLNQATALGLFRLPTPNVPPGRVESIRSLSQALAVELRPRRKNRLIEGQADGMIRRATGQDEACYRDGEAERFRASAGVQNQNRRQKNKKAPDIDDAPGLAERERGDGSSGIGIHLSRSSVREALIDSKTLVILRGAVRRSRRIHCRERPPRMDSATSGATAPFAQNDGMRINQRFLRD